jgi:hypothetical protein
MALSKTVIADKIEIVQTDAGYPLVQVREATIVREDDVEISRSFFRYVLMPDADLSNATPEVAAIAGAVFTETAKQAFAGRPVNV